MSNYAKTRLCDEDAVLRRLARLQLNDRRGKGHLFRTNNAQDLFQFADIILAHIVLIWNDEMLRNKLFHSAVFGKIVPVSGRSELKLNCCGHDKVGSIHARTERILDRRQQQILRISHIISYLAFKGLFDKRLHIRSGHLYPGYQFRFIYTYYFIMCALKIELQYGFCFCLQFRKCSIQLKPKKI